VSVRAISWIVLISEARKTTKSHETPLNEIRKWLAQMENDPVATLYMKGRPKGSSLELFQDFK